MNTDDLDQLRAIAPQRHETSPLFSTAERHVLLAKATSGTGTGTGSRGPRTTRRHVRVWTYRLIPLAAAGIAAAIAVAVTTGPAVPTGHSHSAAAAGRPAAPARTVAYITRHARAAVAGQHSGTLQVRMADKYGVWRDVQDLSSGANRETFRGTIGSIQFDYASAGHGRTGTFKVVDYADRAWWTFKGAVPGPARDFSPHSLRQQLAAGALVRVGEDTIHGQAAIHLRAVKGRRYSVDGLKYLISRGYDIWVSSATFLPIRETQSDPIRVTWDLTWSVQSPAPGQVTAVPPAGFRHRSGPPPSLLKVGGGKG